MSRRITDKETLDFYTDFLNLPTITLGDINLSQDRWRVNHYGTGKTGIFNPASLTDGETGHPGCLRLDTDGGDNPTVHLQCGGKALLKDYTRFACTVKLGNLPGVDENGWLSCGFCEHNVWGAVSNYLFRCGNYSYLNPPRIGEDWNIVGSQSDQPPADYALFWGLGSDFRDTLLLEWQNYDLRISYEKNTIEHYVNGTLVMTEQPTEVLWEREFYPQVNCGEYTPATVNYFLIDEIGWATRKQSIADLRPPTRARNLSSGSTRRDNH